MDHWVNSADAHVLEPADMFMQRLPKRFVERAPRSEGVGEGHLETIIVDGKPVMWQPPEFAEAMRPPGASDPDQRLRDLDSEGIWSELIFPSLAIWTWMIEDPELAAACARAYNDWLVEEFLPISQRFIGVALLPSTDTDDAINEMHRAAERGFKGVGLPTTPPPGRDYNRDVWDPLWAAAEEAGVHLCFHIGTGADPVVARGRGGAVINYTETFLPAQRALAHLVASSALDRHPDLHVFFIEGGASWLPSMMERMDEGYRQHDMVVRPKLSVLPSEIIRRQVHASFQHDRAALNTLEVTGVEAVVWGSDYPHLEGTFPNTRSVVDDIFDGVDPEVRRAVTGGTMAKLFGMPEPDTALPPPVTAA